MHAEPLRPPKRCGRNDSGSERTIIGRPAQSACARPPETAPRYPPKRQRRSGRCLLWAGLRGLPAVTVNNDSKAGALESLHHRVCSELKAARAFPEEPCWIREWRPPALVRWRFHQTATRPASARSARQLGLRRGVGRYRTTIDFGEWEYRLQASTLLEGLSRAAGPRSTTPSTVLSS